MKFVNIEMTFSYFTDQNSVKKFYFLTFLINTKFLLFLNFYLIFTKQIFASLQYYFLEEIYLFFILNIFFFYSAFLILLFH